MKLNNRIKKNIRTYLEYLKNFGLLENNAKIVRIREINKSYELTMDAYVGPKDWDVVTRFLYIDYNVLNAKSDKEIEKEANSYKLHKEYSDNYKESESLKEWRLRMSIKQYAREKKMNPKEYIESYPHVYECICKSCGLENYKW